MFNLLRNLFGGIANRAAQVPVSQPTPQTPQAPQVNLGQLAQALGFHMPQAPPRPSTPQPSTPRDAFFAQKANLDQALRAGRISPDAYSNALNSFEDHALGNKQFTAQDITPSGKSLVGNAAKGLAYSAVQAPYDFLKADIINPTKQLTAQATGNKQAYANAEQSQKQILQPKRLAGDIAQVGLMGAGGTVAKGVGQVVKGAIPRAAITSAALGGPFNAAAELSTNPNAGLKDVAKAGAIGTAAGGVLGFAGGLTAETLHGVTPHVIEHAKALASDQGGFLGFKGAINKHPAIQAIDSHLKDLNAAREQLVANNAPKATVKANGNAYKSALTERNKLYKQISQGGYVGKGPSLADEGGKRPANDIQSQIEAAHNAGDNATVAKLIAQLPADMQESTKSALLPKGVILKESKPLPDGSKIVVRARRNLATKKMETYQERVAKPQATPEQIGAALGMSPEQMSVANAQEAAMKNRTLKVPNSNYGEGEIPPGIKKQLTTAPKPKTAAEANTKLNPFKMKIPDVKQGDYVRARANAQLASSPIDTATGQAIAAVNRLNKNEKGNFWHAVENPSIATTPKLQEAVKRWRELADRTHATSQALGGNTNYLPNYARHNWDLSKPEDAARFQEIINARGGAPIDPYSFSGLDTQPRVFKSILEGEQAGFHLKNSNPSEDILAYGENSSRALKKQALVKGITEADMAEPLKNRSFDLRNGQTISVSQRGLDELKGFNRPEATGKIHSGYRKVNQKAKQTLLSVSQFHPININMQAAPTLVGGPKDWLMGEGHPIRAFKGLIDSAVTLGSKKYSDHLIQNALRDGTIENAARIGTPIKYGSDYTASGRLPVGKAGFGERAIFERQLPAMHIQMVKAVTHDLKNRGIALDSPEAVKAGTAINQIMGYVNMEVRNLDLRTQRGLSDVALAPQFTRSKWQTIRAAVTKGGVEGNLARRAVAGKYVAQAAIIFGLGAVLNQKSDSLKDILYRALLHPSVPTPMKDSKGNNIELGLPANYASEALGLAGDLKRKDGKLGADFKARNVPGNLANYGRSRLAILPNNALKIATNTNYANKPLYDPNAPFGTKAQQSGAIILGGSLPIGLQGLTQLDTVKKHLPQDVQQVITANTPGSNPLVKSVGSSFGLTPRTDKTVGKGLESTTYFNALDEAKKGLNRQEKDALDIYTGGKKNPVTGQYEINPNVNDVRAKATTLLQNPKVIDNLQNMNKSLADQGQNVDPLWQLPKDKLLSYLQYQAMPPGGADRTHWSTANNSWYQPLADKRNAFFNSLPPGDPNKPKAPIEYPAASPQIADKQKTYFNIKDPSAASDYISRNPDLQEQFDKQAEYNNQMRSAQGYSPLDKYIKAAPEVQKIIDTYNALPKNDGPKGGNKTRSLWIQAHPDDYAAMTKYFTQASLYSLEKDAGQAQFQDTGFSQKGLKDIYSLGQYDISKQTDANGNTFYALGSGDNSTSSSTSKKYAAYVKKGRKTGVGSRGGKVKVAHSRLPKAPKIKISRPPSISRLKVSTKSKISSIPKVGVGRKPKKIRFSA